MRKGWEIKKLGDLLEVQNGYAFDSKSFSPSGKMPLIRIRDLKVSTETETRFTGDYDERYLVNAGDLLIGMDGEFGCYEWKGSPALLNQRVCRLQGFSSNLLPRFLLYGVNNHLKEIEDATGFTTVKHLSSKQVLGIEFPLPPLPEQKRIVSILDEAFAGIATAVANTEKNLANARELFESYLNNVFAQKGWVEKRLCDVCDFQGGSQPPKSTFVSKPKPGYVRLLQIRDFKSDNKAVYIAENQAKKRCKDEDVMIGRYGASVGQIHRGKSGAYNVALMKTIPDVTRLDRDYLYFYLLSSLFQDSLSTVAARSAQAGFSKSDIKDFLLPLPPLSAQKRIVSRLNALSSETQRLESLYQHKLTTLAELKQSLLHKAFSGALTAQPERALQEAVA